MLIKRVTLLAVVAIAIMVSGCGGTSGTSADEGVKLDESGEVLNIVAGSEQKKIVEQVVTPWCEDKGYECNFEFMGSVDQARVLQDGGENNPYDAYWFSSSVFQQLGDQKAELKDVKPIFTSPIVLAGWKDELQKLGFVDRKVTIAEVLQAIESGKTKVWITNPTQSNSGATAYLTFLNYLAGNRPTEQLTLRQLQSPELKADIKKFTRSIAKTPPSSGGMVDDCVANPRACKTMFIYEDLVIEKNLELVKSGKQPLYVVYPSGGIAISDAPLGFYPHGDNPEKKATFKALQEYLLSPEAQKKAQALGRRPYNSIGLSLPGADTTVFNPDWGIKAEVNEPVVSYPKADVINAVLDNYQLAYRRSVDAVYCLDGSGSMNENGGWEGVQDAARNLFVPAMAKRNRLQVGSKDTNTVFVFDERVKDDASWTVNGNQPAELEALNQNIQDTYADGGTGIYKCLGEAADYFEQRPTDGRKRLVILMTDGQDEVGSDGQQELLARMEIPVIAIGFGNGVNASELQSIADSTKGSFIESDNMVKALRDATSYK